MTAKEAIKQLTKHNLSDATGFPDERDFEAMKIAIEALEKQIPEKPTYDGDGYAPDGSFVWDEWLCPHCGSQYEVDYDDYDHCPACGQAIDWSEET